ncbi:MAG: MinD/ParA family protein, partial [Deltaproteobacteria bacterium]|nr:MinD/ParA family protein [Deltaproteobacteria bacterium]
LIIRTGHPFNLIGGSSGEFRLANVNYAQKLKFIKHFKQLSRQYDYTIFDLGAGIGRNVLDFALAADQTIIVTTPQDLISGYACAKACFMRHMEIEERFEQKLSGYELSQEYRPYMVINQVVDQREGMRIFKTIEKTADENINANEPRFTIRPEYLGAVLYDKETMRKTESLHKPLLQQFPYSKAAQCIRHISSKFINPQHRYDPRIKVGHRLRRFASVLSNMV